MLPKRLKNYFSARFWPKKSWYIYLRLAICPFDRIVDFLPKSSKKVIDIGGGFGLFADYLKFRNPKLSITVSELDESRMSFAKKYMNKDIKFVTKDASIESFKSYDTITMIDLLHHMPTSLQEKLFKNISSQSKKGTFILVKDIEKDYSFKYYWNYFHDKVMTKGDRLYFRTDKSFKKLFKSNGLKLVIRKRLKTTAPYPHILYLLEKK